MQLRGKEDLRFMRSVTLKECCLESNRSASRSQDSDDEESLDSPSIFHNSQNWNDIHLRLFGQESSVDCVGVEEQSLNQDIIYEVSHYRPESNDVKDYVNIASFSEFCQASAHGTNHNKEDSASIFFPPIRINRPLRQGQQSSNWSMPTSSKFNKESASSNRKSYTLPSLSQQKHYRIPKSTFSSSCHSKSFDHFNKSFPANTPQTGESSWDCDRPLDFSFPTSQNLQFSKQCFPITHTQNHSSEEEEDSKCYQTEETNDDQPLSTANLQRLYCCDFSGSTLALLICLVTVIALVALGSIIYISVTAPVPTDSTTISTSLLQSPQTYLLFQAELCGKKPTNFTVISSYYEERKFPSPEEFVPMSGYYFDEPNYDEQQAPLSATESAVSTEISNKRGATVLKQLSTTSAKVSATKSMKIRDMTINTETRTVLLPTVHASPTRANEKHVLVRHRRVVGGQNTQLGAMPWQVSLWVTFGQDQRFMCGGSLVMKRWIVTAAHCTKMYAKPDMWRAYVGLVALSHKNGPTVQVGKVIYVYNHINYTEMSSSLDYDVSLFQVEKPFSYTEFIQPICLPPQGFELPPDAECYVSGWGNTFKIKKKNQHPDILQRAKINIISRQKCNKWLKGKVTAQMLCAGEPQGQKDACTGDSGGPLSYFDSEKNAWMLAGSVSWGDDPCGRPQTPGVYSKMSRFTNWLWYTIITNNDRL